MSTTSIVVIAVIVVVLGLVASLIIRRQRYVRSLRGRGWIFESTPPLSSVLDHHAPPFGLGFKRDADEGIAGRTRAGVPFRVFEYKTSAGGPKFEARIASLTLPLTLPDLFVATQNPRSGVRYPALDVVPGLRVWAPDAGYARRLLAPPVLAAIAAFGQAGHPVDLGVDGASLVAVGAPKDPDELEAYLDVLDPVVRALDPAALAPYAQAPAPPAFDFHGRPDWVLVGRDDSMITTLGLTRAGSGHRTEQLVRGFNDGLPIEAFLHRWETTRVETSTDANGNTSVRTVTDSHKEVVMAVLLPFDLSLLSVGGGGGPGAKVVRFESEEFNQRFEVRAASQRLAYDIIHPRTMEFLMAVRPPGFRIENRTMRFSLAVHDTQLIGVCADFAHDFLGRIPTFVWDNLRITPPVFRMSGQPAQLR